MIMVANPLQLLSLRPVPNLEFDNVRKIAHILREGDNVRKIAHILREGT